MLRFARTQGASNAFESVGQGWMLNMQSSDVSHGQAMLTFRRESNAAAAQDFKDASHAKNDAGKAIVSEFHGTAEYKDWAALKQRIADTQKELAEAEQVKNGLNEQYTLSISMGVASDQAEGDLDAATSNVVKIQRRLETMTGLLPDAWTNAQRAFSEVSAMTTGERMVRAGERGRAAMAKLKEVIGPLLEELRMATDLAQSTQASITVSVEQLLGPRPVSVPREAPQSPVLTGAN